MGYEYKKRIRAAEQRALKKKKNSQVAKPRQKLSIFLLLSALPVLNYLSVYIALIFTLGQFSSYQFDCQLVFFLFIFSCRLPDVYYRRLVLHWLLLFLRITSPIFVLNRRRSASEKPEMTFFACGKIGLWRAKCPSTDYFRARPTFKQLPDKISGIAGQR